MGVFRPVRWRALLFAPACALALIAGLVGCDGAPAQTTEAMVAAESTPPPADTVDLTVYLRHGNGVDAYLMPLTRQVAISEDLARTALQLLIDGPSPEETVRPVLPATTRIQRFDVEGGTAHVDLSREVVTDAKSLGRRAEHEALALSAVVNTLTEFPEISRVRLTVDGQEGGKFWGSWPLPEVLVRDDRVIEPQARGYLAPQPAGFSRDAQKLGQPQRPLPTVTAVRARPSATFTRITLELASPDGGNLRGPAPPATARQVGDDIVFTLSGAPQGLANGDLGTTFDDPAVSAVDVRVRRRSIVVTVTPDKPRPFKLHTLTDPSRVVLDIRR